MTPGLPFKGIVEERPYPATGLTSALWRREVRPVYVDFADLWLTQKGVRIKPLFGITDRASDAFPHVVLWSGEYYLEDGHHRVTRAALGWKARGLHMRVHSLEAS